MFYEFRYISSILPWNSANNEYRSNWQTGKIECEKTKSKQIVAFSAGETSVGGSAGSSREDPETSFRLHPCGSSKRELYRGACLVRARDDDWLYSASSPPSNRDGRGTWLQCSVVTAKQGGSCYILFLPPYVLFLSLFLHVCLAHNLFVPPLFLSTCAPITLSFSPTFNPPSFSLFVEHPSCSHCLAPTLTNYYLSSFHQHLSLSLSLFLSLSLPEIYRLTFTQSHPTPFNPPDWMAVSLLTTLQPPLSLFGPWPVAYRARHKGVG